MFLDMQNKLRSGQVCYLNALADAVAIYSTGYSGEQNKHHTVSAFFCQLNGKQYHKGDKSGTASFPKDSEKLAMDLNSLICSDKFNFDVKHGAFNLGNGELAKKSSWVKVLLVAIHRLVKSYRAIYEKARAGGIAFGLSCIRP